MPKSLISQAQYDEISSWFQKDGLLMDLGCIPRPSQQLMVDYVTGVLDSGKSLLCEAPTGVGKTYSYLFPLGAVVASQKHTSNPIRVVISTSTKSLQKQLSTKDFPAFNKVFPNVETHVWMGASNYLCGVRIDKALQKTKLNKDVRHELKALKQAYQDLRKLPNGWREELPFEISDQTWDEVCGETRPCCMPDDIKGTGKFCHKRAAFHKALSSDILCLNHSLLCNLSLYVGNIHPQVSDPQQLILVVDEAHDLEDNLRRCLNQSFSFHSLRRHIQKVSNAIDETALLHELNNIRDDMLIELGEEPVVIESASTPLGCILTDLGVFIKKLSRQILDASTTIIRSGTPLGDDDMREIQGIVKGLSQQSKDLLGHLSALDESKLLEVSRPYGNANKAADPIITFSTFNLEDKLSCIWAKTRLNILTSATLFNADEASTSEEYRLPEAETVVIPPNFSYGKAIKSYYIKSPRDKKLLTSEELADWLKPALDASAGNALVLFTSYKSMNESHTLLQSWAAHKGYKILMQSRGVTPGDLVDEMKDNHNRVIFGTSSFWTGIDIKGANLSNVIITKLPFRLLDNYTKRFSKYLEKMGKNPFASWSVPDMITKTRQGIGRLIRDDHDKGLLIMLDPRFSNSNYGHILRDKIYAGEDHKTTLEWQPLSKPSDLAALDLSGWLGVTRPRNTGDSDASDQDGQGASGEEPFDYEDNIPF